MKMWLDMQVHALSDYMNLKSNDGRSNSHVYGRLYLHRCDDFGSLEDWPSFPSFLPAFLDSGSALLFCFFEGALAILLTLSGATEADMDGCKVQLWLRTNVFTTLPCTVDINRNWWCLQGNGAPESGQYLLLLL